MPIALFLGAAICEIAGCYFAWLAIRQAQPLLWVPALLALGLFGALLAYAGTDSAGRTFAVYGGIYIAAAVAFMVVIERVKPDLWDMLGVAICLVGAAVIFFGPRG